MRVAYLAPEIPALSATFVYHEIQAMERLGFTVLPISVRSPTVPATEEAVRDLALRTVDLYGVGYPQILQSSLGYLVRHPLRWLATFGMLCSDMVAVGLVNRTASGLVFRFLASARLARIIEQAGCQHLHAHFAHVPTDLAMYAARLTRIPFSFTSHANDLFERGWLLKKKVVRSAKAVTISEFNRQFLLSQGAPQEKILVVRCGVDETLFLQRPGTCQNPVPNIGSLGRMVEKKGFDTLLLAASLLAQRSIPFHLDIAGYGPLEASLKDLADREGIQDRVSFLGPLPNDRVAQWLVGLDIFALACRQDSHGDMDGIPIVLMEAMASGVPVVSTSISAIPELVVDGKGGTLVPPADATKLADALEKMLLSPEQSRAQADWGRKRILDEFTEVGNARRLAAMFLSSRGGAS